MRACWAAVLGGCGGGFSGEHIISKGLFTGKKVQVQGSPWKTGIPKTIGLQALTANMLCRAHNSAFSEVDDEGIAAFHAIRRFDELLSGRRRSADASDLEHNVRGHLLERWFIKHAINLFVVSGPGRHWYDGSKPVSPPRDIVEAVAGYRQLEHPRGLYNGASKVGDLRVIEDQIEFIPLYDTVGNYAGAFFEFQALSFLIWLDDGRSGVREVPWPNLRDTYHHMGGFFDAGPLRAAFRVHWS